MTRLGILILAALTMVFALIDPGNTVGMIVLLGIGICVALPAVTIAVLNQPRTVPLIEQDAPLTPIAATTGALVPENIETAADEAPTALVDLDAYVSVRDAIEMMGYVPDKALHWRVGNAARKAFEIEYGYGPTKTLRKKLNGGGTNDQAVYPPEFLPTLENIIESEVGLAQQKQLETAE